VKTVFFFFNTNVRLIEDHLRTVFNYKRIPHRTELKFPTLARKKLGINPTGRKKDGSPPPLSTIQLLAPLIADSFAIAEYLENTYPETPSVFPKESAALQKAFEPTLVQNICAAWPFVIPAVALKLNPRSEREGGDSYWRCSDRGVG
jgi:glutathione S-transferase